MKKSALQVGVDVPWVTSWTEEPILGPRPCPELQGRLAIMQTENAGYGRPEYSKNHVDRQRLSVLRMLCPMCGEPTSPDDRVTQVAHAVPAGRLRASGRGDQLPPAIADDQVLIDAGSISPLHRACSDRSLKYCPHLKAADVQIMPFPARWLTLPLLIEATLPSPAGHALLTAAPRPRSFASVTFIQLIGVTGESDPDWGENEGRRRRALTA